MYRGTTPTHIFSIPLDTNIVSKCRVTYAQNDNIVVEKTEADCTFEGKEIRTSLTQAETLKFDHSKSVDIQLRILTVSGDALVSECQRFGVGKVLNDEVLV